MFGCVLLRNTLYYRRDELEENIIVEDDMTGLVGTALYTAPEVAKENKKTII